MTGTIKYCDFKTATNNKEYAVVTFDTDAVKHTVWKTDKAGNTCPFWNSLNIGASGEYTTKPSGKYSDLVSFTPASSPAPVGTTNGTTPGTTRDRQIVIQSSLKCASELAASLVAAGKLDGDIEQVAWEMACGFYERIMDEPFSDPFA